MGGEIVAERALRHGGEEALVEAGELGGKLGRGEVEVAVGPGEADGVGGLKDADLRGGFDTAEIEHFRIAAADIDERLPNLRDVEVNALAQRPGGAGFDPETAVRERVPMQMLVAGMTPGGDGVDGREGEFEEGQDTE